MPLAPFAQIFSFPRRPRVVTLWLSLKVHSAFANGKELFLKFEIVMSETPRRLNLVPCVPLRSDGLELTRRCSGPRPGTLPASRASEHNGAAFCALELQWAKRQDGLICCQVFPLDGRLKMLRDVAGPHFGIFGAIGVRGFAMLEDIKPSPHELPNAEMAWMCAACP
jgi:hypothetical protein